MELFSWLILAGAVLLVDVISGWWKRQQREQAQHRQQHDSPYDPRVLQEDAYSEDVFTFEQYDAELERLRLSEQLGTRIENTAWEESEREAELRESPVVAEVSAGSGASQTIMIPSRAHDVAVPMISVSSGLSVVDFDTLGVASPSSGVLVRQKHIPTAEWATSLKRTQRLTPGAARNAIVWMEILGKPKGLE